MAKTIQIPTLDKPIKDQEDYFRTASLVFVSGWDVQESWYEAQIIRSDTWQLRKVTYNLADCDTMPADIDIARLQRPDSFKIAIIKPDVSLLEAMKLMTGFEKDTLKLGLALPGRDSAESIGRKHYVAFGLTQAIAFDAETGAPSATVRGQIVSEGTFTDATRSAVQAAWEKAQLAPHSPVVRSMFSERRIDDQSLGAYLSVMDDYVCVREIQESYEGLLGRFKECTDYNFKYNSDIESFNLGAKRMRADTSKLPEHYRVFLRTLIDLTQVAFEISRERATLDTSTIRLSSESYSERFMGRVDAVAKLLRDSNVKVDMGAVTATLLDMDHMIRQPMPQVLFDMNEALNRRVRDLQQNANTKRLALNR